MDGSDGNVLAEQARGPEFKPRIHVKKQGVVACAYNPTTKERQMKSSLWVISQPVLLV